MATLFIAHDPMCSWCWGFRPVMEALLADLPGHVNPVKLLGGLAPDSDIPMDESTRNYVQEAWRQVQARIPGTRFNFAFWEQCTPRRSTYPACRAVLAARRLGDPGADDRMIRAIQHAYYLEARNPSDDDVLIELARRDGLDPQAFATLLAAPATREELRAEISHSRSLGLTSFPSLRLVTDQGSAWPVPLDYLDPAPMRRMVLELLET